MTACSLRALLLAAALLGGALAALRAWEADPCVVDSIDGPRPCRGAP